MFDLKGKVVWITGASSGIGKELAIQLSNIGSKLIISAHDDGLIDTKSKCLHQEDVKILQFDLMNHESIKNNVQEALRLFGKIDVLINNAGMTHYYLGQEDTLEIDKKIFDLNFFGTIALTKSLLPHFIKQNHGYIVVTTSVSGKCGIPYRTAYSASKHALYGFFDSLRIELYQSNINILLFGPGFTKTNILKNAVGVGKTKSVDTNSSHANGMPVTVLVKKYIRAIQKEKKEVYTGQKEKMALFLKKFAPRLLDRILAKMEV